MSDSKDDLWGENFKPEPIRAPVTILREQGELLQTKTDYDLRGAVETEASENNNFLHFFFIEVPRLDNYGYRLFYITHKVLSYPLEIGGLSAALMLQLSPTGPLPGMMPGFISAKDEEEFKDFLKRILSSEETQKIVKSLLGQIR